MADKQIHLIDGTYELFRHFFGAPPHEDRDGKPVGAALGVCVSILNLLENGVTHVGVATDAVIESFRNDMYSGYKTGEGIDPELWEQFRPLEQALEAMGVVVWPMKEYEADDGMASAAALAKKDPSVSKILLCTPDKDLAQCVEGDRIVQFDRRNRVVRNAAGVREKFGVDPKSIPDYLALVGDSADGFPGAPGWGAKSAGAILGHYGKLEDIPKQASLWKPKVRGAARLETSLLEHWDDVLLFRELAILKEDAALFDSVEQLRWTGPKSEWQDFCSQWEVPDLDERAKGLAVSRL